MNITERLKECTTRIGSMCGDGRPPRMSIPVREDADDIFITATCLQAAKEIDELRARNSFLQGQLEGADLVLQERDAEIEGWKADQKENLANQCNLQATINAQRNLLEQALEALLHAPWKNWRTDKAITAIQEQLNGQD